MEGETRELQRDGDKNVETDYSESLLNYWIKRVWSYGEYLQDILKCYGNMSMCGMDTFVKWESSNTALNSTGRILYTLTPPPSFLG